METYSRTLCFADLKIDVREIYEYMGYGGNLPDAAVSQLVAQTVCAVEAVAAPVFGYRICEGEVTGVKSVRIEQTDFATGSVITRCLKESERFVVVVASAGEGVDALIRRYHASGDILKEFVADAVGSAVAEAVMGYAKERIEERLGRVTNSYSPGYCGWRVDQQQQLFGLLPYGFCGIVLSPSSLMSPIKSVSAVMGAGKEVVKRPYGCAICEKIDCFKRKK